MTAVHRLVYEYDKKYQHKPGEFTGGVGRMRYRESLDRKTFDEVYALLDQAEKAVLARKGDVVPVLWEKFEFLTADLRKYPRSKCESDAELKSFAGRVAEFIRISGPLARSKQYPYYTAGTKFTVWNLPARTFLVRFCGLQVPTTKKLWTDEPAILEFMKDPAGNMTGRPEKTPGHWRFQHTILRGGENGQVLRRESSGKGRIVCSLKLEDDLQGPVLLTLSGWDDEKPGKTTFRIQVNGKVIFSGENSFPEDGSLKTPAGHMHFLIPAGLLKKGENLITLVNTVPDDPAKAVRQLKNPAQPEDGYTMKQDYFWGWLAVDELRLTAPDDEFLKFAAGKSGTAWTVHKTSRPIGKITNADGKVTIQADGGRYGGLIVRLPENRWLLPKGVKFKMRIKVAGKGLFNAGMICYPADARGVRTKEKMQYSMARFNLPAEPQVFEYIVEQKMFGYCCPYIYLEGAGTAEISGFSLTPIRYSPWTRIIHHNQPVGTAQENEDGSFSLISRGAPFTGFTHKQLISSVPDLPVTIRITASGNGVLEVGFWSYDKDKKIFYPGRNPRQLKLTPEKKEYTLDLKTAGKTAFIKPVIFIGKSGGSAECSDYELTFGAKPSK